MNKRGGISEMIPSVLSVPEKLDRLVQRLRKLRFPMERQFSGRDLLLCVAAFLILLLRRLIPALRGFRLPLLLAALLCVAVPVILQSVRAVRDGRVPLEELCTLLASGLAFLLKETAASVLIPMFAVLLWQTEAYSMLHIDAAAEELQDLDAKQKKAVLSVSPEKSAKRRNLAFYSVVFFAVFLLAAAIFAFLALVNRENASLWLHRCLAALILLSPSAVLFSSRLTQFGAAFSCAKIMVFFRNVRIPETFARCRLFAFGKTGTVTDGRFVISEIVPVGITAEELLRIAAVAEFRSTHPIAMALKAAAGLREDATPAELMDTREKPGKGVCTFYAGHQLTVGNASLLEARGIWYQVPSRSGSAVHVAVDSVYRGYIMISDNLRDNAFEALEELRAGGAELLTMLTGDVRSVSRAIASALNFDLVKSELTPKEKGSAVRYLKSVHGEHVLLAAVGDGHHDKELFQAADLSVCLEPKPVSGADISICSDELYGIPDCYRICRETERILDVTVWGILGVKLLLLMLGTAAGLPTVLLAAADCACSAAAVIWALTGLTLEKRGHRA